MCLASSGECGRPAARGGEEPAVLENSTKFSRSARLSQERRLQTVDENGPLISQSHWHMCAANIDTHTHTHTHTPTAPRLPLCLFLWLSRCTRLLRESTNDNLSLRLPTHMHTMTWPPARRHARRASTLSGQGRKKQHVACLAVFFFSSSSSSSFLSVPVDTCPKFAALLNTDCNVCGQKHEHYASEILKTESYPVSIQDLFLTFSLQPKYYTLNPL